MATTSSSTDLVSSPQNPALDSAPVSELTSTTTNDNSAYETCFLCGCGSLTSLTSSTRRHDLMEVEVFKTYLTGTVSKFVPVVSMKYGKFGVSTKNLKLSKRKSRKLWTGRRFPQSLGIVSFAGVDHSVLGPSSEDNSISNRWRHSRLIWVRGRASNHVPVASKGLKMFGNWTRRLKQEKRISQELWRGSRPKMEVRTNYDNYSNYWRSFFNLYSILGYHSAGTIDEGSASEINPISVQGKFN